MIHVVYFASSVDIKQYKAHGTTDIHHKN